MWLELSVTLHPEKQSVWFSLLKSLEQPEIPGQP